MKTTRLMPTILMILLWAVTASAMDVTIKWDPNTESDLAGYRLYYGVDGLASPSHQEVDKLTPIATASGLDPGKNYSFAVTAYNSDGLESSYSTIVLVPESVPPTISISSPTSNATVSSTVNVSASASDNVGVTRVEFYVNGVPQVTETAAPYVFTWDTSSVAAGAYTLSAKAYDAAGNMGQSSSVPVTVALDTTPPTVAVTAPAKNSTVSGTVTITVTASDNVGVSSVEFYENGTLLSATNVSPYRFNWNSASVPNGNYTLTAKAYDTSGNVSQSGPVAITISNSGVQPPASAVSGDINGDGVLDMSDALLALRFAIGLETPNAGQLLSGDVGPLVDGKSAPDGKIDINDVVVILSAIVGNIAL